MDSNIITQIGIGGIFAVLILQLVFNYLKSRNGNLRDNPAGSKSVEFWQIEQRRAIKESLDIFLISQIKVLERIEHSVGTICDRLNTLEERLRERR